MVEEQTKQAYVQVYISFTSWTNREWASFPAVSGTVENRVRPWRLRVEIWEDKGKVLEPGTTVLTNIEDADIWTAYHMKSQILFLFLTNPSRVNDATGLQIDFFHFNANFSHTTSFYQIFVWQPTHFSHSSHIFMNSTASRVSPQLWVTVIIYNIAIVVLPNDIRNVI